MLVMVQIVMRAERVPFGIPAIWYPLGHQLTAIWQPFGYHDLEYYPLVGHLGASEGRVTS